MELIKIENKNYVDARELHKDLGIKKGFTNWLKDNIVRAMLTELDFITSKAESTGGRPKTECLLTKESAIAFVLISGGKFAREVRTKLIELFKKHETGLAFTSEQITSLMDLAKSMTLISIQKDVECKHYALYNHPETWWKYRADLLGYSKDTLIEAMKKVNKKHKSIRTSLIKLDANELIRTGVIDLFKALGKTDEYSINVGNLCKQMAEKMELNGEIWDDTKPNELGLNSAKIESKKQGYNEITGVIT